MLTFVPKIHNVMHNIKYCISSKSCHGKDLTWKSRFMQTHARTQLTCTCIMHACVLPCVHTHVHSYQPFTMEHNLESVISWGKLAEILYIYSTYTNVVRLWGQWAANPLPWSKILRASLVGVSWQKFCTFIVHVCGTTLRVVKGAMRFWGNTVFKQKWESSELHVRVHAHVQCTCCT